MAEQMVIDPDAYDISDVGVPVKVSHQEYIDRKRKKLEYQIKYHQLMVYTLQEQLENTTTIQL